MMNKEIKEKWVAALRQEGKYKQGVTKLRSVSDEFCCLGVLCDISDQGHWEKENSLLGHKYVVGVEGSCQALPYILRDGLGIKLEEVATLIILNDVERLPFTKIADHIEAAL